MLKRAFGLCCVRGVFMSLRLKRLGVAAMAASGLLALTSHAAAQPQQPTDSNPWVTPGADPAPINGRAAMALQDGGDSRYVGIDNLSRAAATSGGVPEPAAWALMIVGFGGVGGLLRRRRARRLFTGA